MATRRFFYQTKEQKFIIMQQMFETSVQGVQKLENGIKEEKLGAYALKRVPEKWPRNCEYQCLVLSWYSSEWKRGWHVSEHEINSESVTSSHLPPIQTSKTSKWLHLIYILEMTSWNTGKSAVTYIKTRKYRISDDSKVYSRHSISDIWENRKICPI